MILVQTLPLCARRCSLLQKTARSVSRPIFSSSTINTQQKNVKAFDALPGPGLLQNIASKFQRTDVKHLYEDQGEKFERFGPIYKEKIAGQLVVNVADADATALIAQTEGSFPIREFPHLELVKDTAAYRLMGNDYETWKETRSPIAPSFLRPVEIRKFAPGINTVTKDAVRRLQKKVKDGRIVRFSEELQGYMAENILLLVYGERMGFYDEPPNFKIIEFVKTTDELFSEAVNLGVGSQMWRLFPTARYKKFVQAKKKVCDIAEQFADIKRAKQQKRDHDRGVCLYDILSNTGRQNSTDDAINQLAIALSQFGVDTTGRSLEWFFYHISLHPEIQERAYDEIVSVIGTPSNDKSSEDPQFHSKLPYLNACIQESMRVNPISFVLPRTVPKDTVLCGYEIPAGTIVRAWFSPMPPFSKYFSRPEKFDPERWIRSEGKREVHPFASLPFGFGVRKCLGHRLSKMEMPIAAAHILRSFRLEYVDKEPVNRVLVSNMMFPDRELPIKFVQRA